MGVLISTGLHYRTAGGCVAGIVTVDNPPVYDTVTLAEVASAVTVLGLSVLATSIHEDVEHDTESPATTNGTWHYPNECPDA